MANSSSGSAAEGGGGGEERETHGSHRKTGVLTAGYPHLGGGSVVIVVQVEASARCIKQARVHCRA
jgi:hypothetical protein